MADADERGVIYVVKFELFGETKTVAVFSDEREALRLAAERQQFAMLGKYYVSSIWVTEAEARKLLKAKP